MNDYPITFKDDTGVEHDMRLMAAEDRDALVEMTKNLSEQDMWFMRRDLTQPEAVDAWVNDIEISRAITLLVVAKNGDVVAHGSLYHNQLAWNRHLAEVRIMVTQRYRNRGLGGKLTRELVAIAKELGFDKIFSYMSSADKGAQSMLQSIGFSPEALLGDWIKTKDGTTVDLVIMSASVDKLAR